MTASLKEFAATVLLVLALAGFVSPPRAVGAYQQISRAFDAISAWVSGSADPAPPPGGPTRR